MNENMSVKLIREKVIPLTIIHGDKKGWPEKSDYLCLHCSHAFSWVPAFIPVRLHHKRNTLSVTGNFCSWNCAKYYLNHECKNEIQNMNTYLTMLAFYTSYRNSACSVWRGSVHTPFWIVDGKINYLNIDNKNKFFKVHIL